MEIIDGGAIRTTLGADRSRGEQVSGRVGLFPADPAPNQIILRILVNLDQLVGGSGEEYQEQLKVKELPHMMVLDDPDKLKPLVVSTMRRPWTELLHFCTTLGFAVARQVADIRRGELGPSQVQRGFVNDVQAGSDDDEERELSPDSTPRPVVQGQPLHSARSDIR